MNPSTNEPESAMPMPPPPLPTAVVLVGAVVILAIVTVTAMVITSFALPDNPALGDRIVTYAGGITTGLMLLLRSTQNANGIQKIHLDLNSRLTAFLKDQALAERAKGVLEGVEATAGSQRDAHIAATVEAAHVVRVATEAATAAADKIAQVATEAADKVVSAATEAAAVLAASASAPAIDADGAVHITAPALIDVAAPESS